MRKIVLITLIVLNVVVLLGQLWPDGAPPFASFVNIFFLCCSFIYFLSVLFADRFKYTNEKSAAAVSLFNKLAKQYQDKYMDVSLYHHSFDIFCRHISKPNAEILELACGPGNITKY